MNNKEHTFDKYAYDIAREAREFEIKLFLRRSVFFWGFIAATFIAYASLFENEIVAIIIATFGFMFSILWTLANRTSRFWQEHWEFYIGEIENKLKINIYGNPYYQEKKRFGNLIRSSRYSVSALIIALSDYTIIIWFFLLLLSLSSQNDFLFLYIIPTFIAISIAYTAYVFIFTRSSLKENEIIRK